MNKLDLSNAFHHILVDHRDWDLLGSTWLIVVPMVLRIPAISSTCSSRLVFAVCCTFSQIGWREIKRRHFSRCQSKAFDAINHAILLNKMKKCFCSSSIELKWFESYLSNREQQCSIMNNYHPKKQQPVAFHGAQYWVNCCSYYTLMACLSV